MKFLKLLLFSLTFINLNSSENLHSRRTIQGFTEIDICYKRLTPDFLTIIGCGKSIRTETFKLRLKTKLTFKELKQEIIKELFQNYEEQTNLTFKFFQHNVTLNNVTCVTYINDNDAIDLNDYNYIDVLTPEVEARLRSK